MLVSIRALPLILLIPLISSLHPIYSEEQGEAINFFNIEDTVHLNGQLISIRGFLYETAESQMILAAEPNLKSCCVGSTTKRQRQLLVTGNLHSIPDAGKAVTLQGNLVVAMGDNFPLRLENSVIVPEKDQCYWVLGLVGLGLILLSGGVFFWLRKRL